MQKGKRSVLPGIDYITLLIILIFLAMALGVFLYYKKRLNTIRHQLRQTGWSPLPSTSRTNSIAQRVKYR